MQTQNPTWTPDEQATIEVAHLKQQLPICPKCSGYLDIGKKGNDEQGCSRLTVHCLSCDTQGHWNRDPQSHPRWTSEDREAYRAGKPYCSCGAKITLLTHVPRPVPLCRGCGNS
jgi:hypothetical protein